jgi:Phosphoinositide phospholipase C, Ca2+-dependent
MITRSAWACWLAVLLIGLDGRAADWPRVDQIQVIGSHNSYHLAPHPNVQNLLGPRMKAAALALDYTHRPLAEQFSRLGLRQIELDVFADPEGGHYADPLARKVLKGMGKEPGPDPNADGRLRKPGFKVFHIQDIDYQSTVTTLLEALRQVRDWSAAHPRHVPILVLLELKDEPVVALPTRPATFGKAELDAIDSEIRSVFSPADFLAPDDVRGTDTTLGEAVKSRGWPSLEASRGKVIFALDNEGDLCDLYLVDHEALRGRAMFVSVPPDHPAAAWMKRNEPVRQFEEIQRLVKEGFLVRTRADADTSEARKDDSTRREKALASGAQYISTDFPEPRPEISSYQVRLPGGVVARSNPVSGDPALAGIDLEVTTSQPARP